MKHVILHLSLVGPMKSDEFNKFLKKYKLEKIYDNGQYEVNLTIDQLKELLENIDKTHPRFNSKNSEDIYLTVRVGYTENLY